MTARSYYRPLQQPEHGQPNPAQSATNQVTVMGKTENIVIGDHNTLFASRSSEEDHRHRQ
jgi:hypothetical protein